MSDAGSRRPQGGRWIFRSDAIGDLVLMYYPSAYITVEDTLSDKKDTDLGR